MVAGGRSTLCSSAFGEASCSSWSPFRGTSTSKTRRWTRNATRQSRRLRPSSSLQSPLCSWKVNRGADVTTVLCTAINSYSRYREVDQRHTKGRKGLIGCAPKPLHSDKVRERGHPTIPYSVCTVAYVETQNGLFFLVERRPTFEEELEGH